MTFFGIVTNVFLLVCFKRFFIPQNVCLSCFRSCIILTSLDLMLTPQELFNTDRNKASRVSDFHLLLDILPLTPPSTN